MASHCLAQGTIDDIAGLIFYGFPLHAPGKPSAKRADHLADVQIPMLFLQGANDQLAQIDLITELCKGLSRYATLKIYQDANHSFQVPKSAGIDHDSMIRKLAEHSKNWIESLGKNPTN